MNIKENSIKMIFLASGLLSIFILLGIFYLLFSNSFPALRDVGIKSFFSRGYWNPTAYSVPQYSILNIIKGTFMVGTGSLLFAVPLGVACAAYLAEVASPREREIFKPIIEILAGIPSVVLGFFGLVVVAPLLSSVFGLPNGINALNGSILVGIMALPTVVSLAEDAVSAVPQEYRHASLALGATRWQTLKNVTIPAAFSGVLAASLLGMGRAIGETMTVLMVTGNALAAPSSFMDSVRTLSANIAIEMGEVPMGSLHFHSLFVVGLVLFIITFIINLLADIIFDRYRKGVSM
ncbi:MAG: phosphate ABC transporter permease subunit PstC [Dethiobacter sp.]|jgi:phosphate transport system permease protein|nr:MAG: phosphate ABC transporter permease subunit PstC [Dethiobacter sp.]